MPAMQESERRDSCLEGVSEWRRGRTIGPLCVNFAQSEVKRNGDDVYLTKLELRLLRYLIESSGRVVSRDELLRSVWGYESNAFTRTVDMHVHSLRHKIEENSKRPELIITVRGTGYKFVARTADF